MMVLDVYREYFERVSKRIRIARMILIFGIVVLHIPPYQPLAQLGTAPFDLIKALFSHGIFRATVPVLTAISGYLLFSAGLDKYPQRLFLKKSRTILLPLLVWNVPLVLVLFFIQKNGLIAHNFSVELVPVNWMTWSEAMFGLYSAPLNYPTNFLRDLFAVALLAPVLGLFLRRAPYIGLVVAVLVYHFNAEGIYILRNSMLITFYFGGMAAVQKWDLHYLDKYAPYLLGTFLLFAFLIVVLKIENREWFSISSPFLVWPSLALIVNTKFGTVLEKYSGYSFFIFLVHAPILFIMWMLYKEISLFFPYPVFWLLSPFLVVYASLLIHNCFKTFAPRLINFAVGTDGYVRSPCIAKISPQRIAENVRHLKGP